MVSNEPINLDGSTRDRAKAKAWQGALTFLIGAGITALTGFVMGIVFWWSIAIAVGGLFWMATGLITVFTEYE